MSMKTYQIEVQHIKSLSNAHGLVNARIDALVLARPARDEGDGSSVLSLSVENARVLYLLLKAQLAEVDARKARSQR
jgi:hypothetical protein